MRILKEFNPEYEIYNYCKVNSDALLHKIRKNQFVEEVNNG